MRSPANSISSVDELPMRESIVSRFGLYETDGLCNPQVNSDGTVSCSCLNCFCWHSFLEGRLPEGSFVQYEVLTREYVHGLAAYLRERAIVYGLAHPKVLEVGAGDGRLSHFLRVVLEPKPQETGKVPVFDILATDNGQRGLASGQPFGSEVRKQDAVEAIHTERPHIVIACWQPLGVDWTAAMRRTESVLEYILIGEKDGGICGHPWLTWGVKSYDDCKEGEGISLQSEQEGKVAGHQVGDLLQHEKADNEFACPKIFNLDDETEGTRPTSGRVSTLRPIHDEKKDPLQAKRVSVVDSPDCSHRHERTLWTSEYSPPHEVDGFERHDLLDISQSQIGRTDERWSTRRQSCTVSFRRLISPSSRT